MSDSIDSDPKTTLETLISSLSTVENSLESLLENEGSSTWSEKVEKLSMMDRAKMDVLVSYTVNDLIWIYLKLKGVDPEKHEVTGELDRIKTYYTKIKSIEEPDTRRNKIDQSAAHRFIKSSLPRSQHLPPTSAAQLAAQQAQNAVAEQEQEESLRRLSKAGRFRFIEKEGRETIIPGQGGEDEDMEEDDDAGTEGEGDDGVNAEEFLKGVEEEMKGQ
ncbi:hypothetical protein I302_105821 [Kwoniella bestiolae CBS 10118]|uniref:Exosome complex protein n=1 Tax=Kwoniella bestiolae CBS 10118 TaxID=1296100 RepID=A0A1B9G286_9TREE|nr:hypothetical protein I302_04943 [Kwoniella bestiolae CBS 10118]OCF25133.1 hypothetical protein I302_04943 [Kwoniella bestiolae CBS 10118]